jgi:hypothetical protein
MPSDDVFLSIGMIISDGKKSPAFSCRKIMIFLDTFSPSLTLLHMYSAGRLCAFQEVAGLRMKRRYSETCSLRE